MAIDSTYLFFKRDLGDDDRKHAHAPVISTTRVSKRGGLRSGSVPPIHFGTKVSRTGSVAPPPRRGSIARAPAATVVRSAASTSISRIPATATSVSSLSSSTGGHLARPILRRASIAAPGGSNLRIYTVGSVSGTPTTASLSGRVGVSEVTKGSGIRSSIYRPYSQAAHAVEVSEVAKGGTGIRTSIYRPSSHATYGRSAAVIVQPKVLPHARSSVSVGGGSGGGGARTPLPHRRASISTTGWWDEDYLSSVPLPPLSSVKATPSTIPLNRRSYAGFSSRGSIAPSAVPARKPLRGDDDDVHLPPTAASGGHVSRRYGFSSKEPAAPVRTSDNDIHPKKKLDYESQLESLIPVHEESLAKLRARTQQAKDHLSRHRVLLDRYLPLQLGPENEVQYEVESRYGELLSRMPQLEQRARSKKEQNDVYVIPPYKPAAPATKAQKLTYEISSIPVKNSFTPKMSDTRKRARNVLCKIHGDPRYFDFS